MNYRTRERAGWALGVMLAMLPLAAGAAEPSPRVVESETHRFEEVAAGVWMATGTGAVQTVSNSMVLVGEFDTLIVDSHVTPAAARALLAALAAITDRPVRYLVNTHYHFDHAHGNQAFPAGIEIIGHEFTRAKLAGEVGNVLEENTYRSFTDGVPATVIELAERAAAAGDPQRRAELEREHRLQRDYQEALGEVVPTPPNITLERKLTLFQATATGSREVQLLHFGRGHTAGDVVVYLPQERVVFTGDLALPFLAYMGDGHVDEWPATLDGLLSLEFDVWMPGHGPTQRSRQPIRDFQAFLRDLWVGLSAAHEQGLSAAAATEALDLGAHYGNFPQLANGVDGRAVARIYELLGSR